MRVLLIIFTIKLVSCTQYYYDVNQLHDPLTTFDKASKSVKYCVYMNNKTLDNNYLLGTWYTIYRFAERLVVDVESNCKMTNFTKPTKEDIDGYKAKYDLRNETFSFDSSAVICSFPHGYHRNQTGIVVGDRMAKYYFLDPKSNAQLSGMYNVLTYKPVNNNYLIYYDCSMRGHMKYLWSRKRNQTEEELEGVIKPLYEHELKNMKRQRLCEKRKVVTTTPYF